MRTFLSVFTVALLISGCATTGSNNPSDDPSWAEVILGGIAAGLGAPPPPASRPSLPAPVPRQQGSPYGHLSSGPAASRVPDVTRCVKYENYNQVGFDPKGTTRWFLLRNTCGQELYVYWCHRTGGSPCSNNMPYAAEIASGGQTTSWFNRTQVSGIQWVACPVTYQGKRVHLDKSTAMPYCKVYN